jgi:hypothetical protein
MMLCVVCVLVCFVVSGVAPPGFSEFAGNIINLGINTTRSRKLLTSNPDKNNMSNYCDLLRTEE